MSKKPNPSQKPRRATRSLDPAAAQINYQTYTDQVLEHLPVVLRESFEAIYDDAVNYCREYNENTKPRQIFRRLLNEIEAWDEEDLQNETDFILEKISWLPMACEQILVTQALILLSANNTEYVQRPSFVLEMPPDVDIVRHFLLKAKKAILPHLQMFELRDNDDEESAADPDQQFRYENNMLGVEEVIRKQMRSALHTLVPIDKIVAANLKRYKAMRLKRREAKHTKETAEAEAEAEADAEADAEAEAETDAADAAELTNEPVEDEKIKEEQKEEARREIENEEKPVEEHEITAMHKDAERRRKIEKSVAEEREWDERRMQEKLQKRERFEQLSGEEQIDETAAVLLKKLKEMSRDDPERKGIKRRLREHLQLMD